MNDALQSFAEVFVPLFAVMNVLPVLPIVIASVEPLSPARRAPVLRRAFLTGAVAGTATSLVGGLFLSWLGVELDDFRVAGGIILLVFAVHDLLFSRVERKRKAIELDGAVLREVTGGATGAAAGTDAEGDEAEEIGVVPLGIPILFGPAGMTALVVYSQTVSPERIYPAFALNLAINGLLLWRADWVARRLGRPLIRATGKIMGVVLASLAVSMLRVGITRFVRGG